MRQGAGEGTATAGRNDHARGGAGNPVDRSARRLFADENGVLWTAELRRPRHPTDPARTGGPLILFWSETRACLASVRNSRPLSDLTEDDLRLHLRACLSG